MELAFFIESRIQDMSKWIGLLNRQGQVQVLGNLKMARREGVSLRETEYVDLSDLVTIVKRAVLYEQLGYQSKSAWDKVSGPLVELRHQVMHPVRTLVAGGENAGNVVQQDKHLRELVKRLQQINS